MSRIYVDTVKGRFALQDLMDACDGRANDIDKILETNDALSAALGRAIDRRDLMREQVLFAATGNFLLSLSLDWRSYQNFREGRQYRPGAFRR